MADRGRRVRGDARGAGELNVPGVLRERRVQLGAAAVVAVLVVFAAGALVGGWRPFSSEPEVFTFGPGADLPAFSLFDGQCAGGTLGDGRSYGPDSNIPCGNPHDVEVVGTATPLNQSREVVYPGAGAMAEFGRAFCAMVVDSGQVKDASGGVTKSDLTVAAVVPGPAVFADPNSNATGASGGRLVSCVITLGGGAKLTDRFAEI